MGAYLLKPITEKVSSDEEGVRVIYGASSMQGWRVTQEDAHNCLLNFDEDTSLFAVYDGHGGHEVASYTAHIFPSFLKKSTEYQNGNYAQALSESFLAFDNHLISPAALQQLELLSKDKMGDNEDPSSSPCTETDENVDALWEEARMPLEEVMAKYQSHQKGTKKFPLKSDGKNQSPMLKAPVDYDAAGSSTTLIPSDKTSPLACGSSSDSVDIANCSTETQSPISSSSLVSLETSLPSGSDSSTIVIPNEPVNSSSFQTTSCISSPCRTQSQHKVSSNAADLSGTALPSVIDEATDLSNDKSISKTCASSDSNASVPEIPVLKLHIKHHDDTMTNGINRVGEVKDCVTQKGKEIQKDSYGCVKLCNDGFCDEEMNSAKHDRNTCDDGSINCNKVDLGTPPDNGSRSERQGVQHEKEATEMPNGGGYKKNARSGEKITFCNDGPEGRTISNGETLFNEDSEASDEVCMPVLKTSGEVIKKVCVPKSDGHEVNGVTCDQSPIDKYLPDKNHVSLSPTNSEESKSESGSCAVGVIVHKQAEDNVEQEGTCLGMKLKSRRTYHELLVEPSDSESDDEGDQTFQAAENSSDEDNELDEDEADEEAEEEEEEDGYCDDEEEEEDADDDSSGDTDDDQMSSTREVPGIDSGCTAVVALLHGLDLYVANAGDSRCVLCHNGKAVDMSFDHKPEDEEEMERIINAGGKVTGDGRVNGGLNLSRALGDHAYKQNITLCQEEQMITALPDIQKYRIDPKEDEFMILACDGIWNYMSSQEVVDFVRKRISGTERLSVICEELFDHCLAPNTLGDGTGCDNMTAVIVKFFNSNHEEGTTKSSKRPRPEVSPDDRKRLKTDDKESTET